MSVKKADHRHEYIRVVTRLAVRTPDGNVRTYKLSRWPECVACGATKRWSQGLDYVEVEVSPEEFRSRED